MSHALTAACIWALAATLTALLPMRMQFPPGITLLILAPVILIWIGATHGVWLTLAATLGFLSMFRRPLWYLGHKALGLPTPPRPSDPQPGDRDP